MNKTYLYDGKFSSLLALIYILIKNNNLVFDIKSEEDYEYNLLERPVYLNIVDKSKKVSSLKKLLTTNIIKTVRYLYLSATKDKELVIYEFIKYAIKYKNEIYYMRGFDIVNKVYKISHKVTMETHHIKGFLRFKKMKNNFYYATINPTNNILCLITDHFKKRLKNEYWLIKDVNRNIYAMYDKNKVTYLKEEDIINLNLNLDSNEEQIQNLWISFFKTIGIKERENKQCQMNFMPKKYWKYIIEMESEYEESNK